MGNNGHDVKNGSASGNDNDRPAEQAAGRDSRLSVDATLELLAHRHRRALLSYFVDSDEDAASVDEIVSRIIEVETAASGRRPGHNQVENALHHIHLPKLADAGIVEHDSRSQSIRYRGEDHLETWLERIRNEERG